MSKKKLIINIAVIMSALVLFAFWYHMKFENVVPTISLRGQKIYLITVDKKEEFAFRINEGVSDMAKLAGISYIWDAPEVIDVDEQIKVINNAVNSGADLILLAALDPVRISKAVEDAKAKGVKIIYVDAPANEEAVVTLATDNYSAGRIAGELMIEELEAKGISVGSIGILRISQGIVTTLNRELGFRDAIEQDGKYQLLETKFAEEEPILIASENAARAFINENTDLVGMFGTSEISTIGMGNVLADSNKSVVGIGFDITDTIREMIKNNVIQATLVQNPYSMGYLGMAEAIAALTGKNTGPPFINTGVSIVTKYTRNVIR